MVASLDFGELNITSQEDDILDEDEALAGELVNIQVHAIVPKEPNFIGLWEREEGGGEGIGNTRKIYKREYDFNLKQSFTCTSKSE